MSRSDYLFLKEMDATREMRTMGRPDHWMMNGFRQEWNRYIDECVDVDYELIIESEGKL